MWRWSIVIFVVASMTVCRSDVAAQVPRAPDSVADSIIFRDKTVDVRVSLREFAIVLKGNRAANAVKQNPGDAVVTSIRWLQMQLANNSEYTIVRTIGDHVAIVRANGTVTPDFEATRRKLRDTVAKFERSDQFVSQVSTLVMLPKASLPAMIERQFVVRFNEDSTLEQAQEFGRTHKLDVRRSEYRKQWFIYRLKPDDTRNPLQVARTLSQSGKTKWADIDLTHLMMSLSTSGGCQPYSTSMKAWHHQNSNVDDADIDTIEAWTIESGQPSTKIAVIDDG